MILTEPSIRARFFSNSAGPRYSLHRGSPRCEHIVAAWKDTREARRAVMDAIPFLRAAKRVSVVEVCARDQERNALARIDDVVRYLARHRINADPRSILHRDRSDADHLFQFALD